MSKCLTRALITAIPAVKAALDYDSFNQEINNLIVQAGDVTIEDYNPHTPAHPNEALFKWIKDSSLFNKDVRKKLMLVQKKHVPTENHYIQKYSSGNINPEIEEPYLYPLFPDENYRLLGLFRYWNIIQYFYPNKDDIEKEWKQLQLEFIPRLIDAANPIEYGLTVKELTTRIKDSHGPAEGGYIDYYFGLYYVPFTLSFIENQTVVTHVYSSLLDSPDDVRVGDIIIRTHDQDINEFRQSVRKYAYGSNEAFIERNINNFVLRGNTNRLSFTLLRDGQTIDIIIPAYHMNSSVFAEVIAEEESQMTKWKILPGNIGYVHMGILEQTDVAAAMAELSNTRAIIFDIRNYPNGTLYLISHYLNSQPEEYAKVMIPEIDYPGDFYFTPIILTGDNNPDYYRGKVILLLNEMTLSQAEHTCMVLETAPDVTKIGSQTAGAVGNYSKLYFPGAISTNFTGLGYYYPDGTPTQRIGIVPDIEVHPTVQGIQDGRDEVLEFAIQFIENN